MKKQQTDLQFVCWQMSTRRVYLLLTYCGVKTYERIKIILISCY